MKDKIPGTLPRTAVLMAAYNAEKTIDAAVDSVLASIVPVDLHIIDDGSHHPLQNHFHDTPPNVYIHRLEQNSGLPSALNAGLEIILKQDYEFVARFDADDYAYPERFKVQEDYLDSHPDVQVVGCRVNAVGEDRSTPLFTISHPERHEDIVRAMYYNSAFIHPSLVFRAQALRHMDRHYNVQYRIAQDYELMSRVIRTCKTANVPQVLIDYSYLSEISSPQKRRRQLLNRLKIQLTHFAPLNIHSWLGIAKTACLALMPMRLTTMLKGMIYKKQK